MIIRPHEGPQEQFASTSADICIFGAGAGVGKSYALLMEPLRHIKNKNFGAVCFRRTMPQVLAEGGLWDTAAELYSGLSKPVETPHHKHTFKSGAKITFTHLQHDKNIRDWDGSQIPLLLFDELQHFTENQFFKLLARNRSTCGIKPYVRATCNPDPDSFLREFLSWWIDQKTGYPIMERSGKIRYMVRISGEIHWADSPKELKEKFPHEKDLLPKSVTFIPAKLSDNPSLMEADPGYLANLRALPEYEQKRLIGGNWFARPSAGELFKRSYFKIIELEEVPLLKNIIRYWDRAATVPNEKNKDPDWTSGCKIGMDSYGRTYIFNITKDRMEPFDVEQLIKVTAMIDGKKVSIGIEQDPGSAGKMEADYYIRQLTGYPVEAYPKNKNKLAYWKPLAAQAKAGNVYLVNGPWVELFLSEAEGVTDGTQSGHDDQVDSAAGGFMVLSSGLNSSGAAVGIDVF